MEKCAMTPPRRLSLFLALAALLVPLAGNAQVLGSIAGSVRDASGAVLPGVTVEAASPALIEKVRSAVTDGSGQYTIVNLPPGTYSVSFTLPGFSTVKREALQVSVNFTSNVDAEMRVGAVEETITVTGESPDRRPAVFRDHAAGNGPGVQGAAIGRLVGPAGGADARGAGPATWTWAASWATRRVPRFRRTAAARPTASR